MKAHAPHKLAWLILLTLVQLCCCRPAPAARITDESWLIPNQMILLFEQSVSDEAAAAAELVMQIKAAVSTERAEAATAASDASTDPQSSSTPFLEVISKLDGSAVVSHQEAVAVAAVAAATPAASSSIASASSRGLIIKARPEAVKLIARLPMVAAVIPDRFVRTQRVLSSAAPAPEATAPGAHAAEAAAAQCTTLEDLAAGFEATPRASFKWPQCISSSTTTVWVARTCGGSAAAGFKVQYTEVRALDKYTGEVFKFAQNGRLQDCILTPDTGRATWSKQTFGTCGKAPQAAPSLPGRVKICSEGPTPTSPLPPPPGSPTAPPSQSPTPPSPESPAPGTDETGQGLPRVAIGDGQQLPQSLLQIEAARKSSGGTTTVPCLAGIPAAQRVVAGVIDSGIDAKHYDLEYTGGQSFHPVDKEAGVDNYGHGTHIAGIIGAKNNNQGVVGISPGIPLYSLKVLDEYGQGSLSSTMTAVRWVIDTGSKQFNIKVINLSLLTWVDPTSSDYANYKNYVCSLMQAASDAGIVVTVAAGNSGGDMRAYFPAACPTVAAVTSLDVTATQPSSISNFLPAQDATAEDKAKLFSAPGTSILSTISQDMEPSGLYTLSGTSMAAPVVAAVAANCLMSGACIAGATGVQQLAVIKAAALERSNLSPSYSYSDSRADGRLYGPLVWSKY